MLSGSGLREEGVEGVVAAADGLVRRHLTVRVDAMLETAKTIRNFESTCTLAEWSSVETFKIFSRNLVAFLIAGAVITKLIFIVT
jgi:hypothetical protein